MTIEAVGRIRCPSCDSQRNHVLDTRGVALGYVIRRRRHCERCGARFSTYEFFVRPIVQNSWKMNRQVKEIADKLKNPNNS